MDNTPYIRSKICGLTTVADAQMVMHLGVDAIGLVFYEPSPRYVSIHQARQITKAVGPFVTVVGLFVNASKAAIDHVINQVLCAFYNSGDESASECDSFSLPYMKAIAMREDVDVHEVIDAP